MKRSITLVLVCFLATTVGTGCARQPGVTKSNSVIRKYFVHYAKKYPTSVMGQAPLGTVTTENIAEIHKGFVAATARLEFQGGRSEAVRCSIENRPPLGWRVVSWERLQ